jgi:hypothetical protein
MTRDLLYCSFMCITKLTVTESVFFISRIVFPDETMTYDMDKISSQVGKHVPGQLNERKVSSVVPIACTGVRRNNDCAQRIG